MIFFTLIGGLFTEALESSVGMFFVGAFGLILGGMLLGFPIFILIGEAKIGTPSNYWGWAVLFYVLIALIIVGLATATDVGMIFGAVGLIFVLFGVPFIEFRANATFSADKATYAYAHGRHHAYQRYLQQETVEREPALAACRAQIPYRIASRTYKNETTNFTAERDVQFYRFPTESSCTVAYALPGKEYTALCETLGEKIDVNHLELPNKEWLYFPSVHGFLSAKDASPVDDDMANPFRRDCGTGHLFSRAGYATQVYRAATTHSKVVGRLQVSNDGNELTVITCAKEGQHTYAANHLPARIWDHITSPNGWVLDLNLEDKTPSDIPTCT